MNLLDIFFKFLVLPYFFFGYKTVIFLPEESQRSRSILFWKGKSGTIAKFHRTGIDICSHSREGKACLIAE